MSTKDLSIREKMILSDNLRYQIDEFLSQVVIEYIAISKCFAASYFAKCNKDSSKYVVMSNNFSKAIKRPRNTFEILIKDLATDLEYRITVPTLILEASDVAAREAILSFWVEAEDNAVAGKYTFEDATDDGLKR